ncbi:hypothetical protein QEH56_11440 [Pelagicoccus enzymogenes]|uniref:hypothetical protein n=1 Tax=Pelagicoccus enzymogenes TaxID=2773457 RepID=UPI0028108AC1|nr:hypothetical protein [Pelagicoccus enzymogenes]MDQ8198768.1 hypothetical protein [Pelagicoccus enzymogenes]
MRRGASASPTRGGLWRKACKVLVLGSLCGDLGSLSAAPYLTHLWTYDSSTINPDPVDAREILNVGLNSTVSSSGSIAFTVVTGLSENNSEQRLFWFDKDQDDTDNPAPAYMSPTWESERLLPMVFRRDHLVYSVNGDELHSLYREDDAFTDQTIGTFTSADTSWMSEKARSPGVLYVFEAAVGDTSFKLHAYQILPVATDELLEPVTVGVDGDNITLYFQTVADAMYQLESSSDMATWTEDGAQIVGNGAQLLIQRAAPESGETFYRLRKL